MTPDSIMVGEWRWIRPDASAEDYLDREWRPGLVVELAGRPVVSAFLEADDGRRATVAIDRVSTICTADEFTEDTWTRMSVRAAFVRAHHKKGETCSR